MIAQKITGNLNAPHWEYEGGTKRPQQRGGGERKREKFPGSVHISQPIPR